MCGFAALFAPSWICPPDVASAIEQDLYHRGPDSGGHVTELGFSLIFRRLSIMDPAARSDQPMTSPDGRYTLIFNGEIYNFRTIRMMLEQAGHQFVGTGDSEVILRGFMEWGSGVFDYLEGMYACVIVDRVSGRAIAARDPLGIKPLYLRRGFLVGRPSCAFASTATPLARLAPTHIDPHALGELIVFTWAAGRLSNLLEVERVPGGTVIEVDLKSGEIVETRQTDPLRSLERTERSELADLSREALIDALDDLVQESVRAHLMSDVGFSVQLSGGVDSSLIAAIASKQSEAPIASFGVKIDDPNLDEASHRAAVVASVSLNHHECPTSGMDFAELLPTAVAHMEGPVPHGGCVMLLKLCGEIAKTSKVVLTGEGADEFFGGYFRYGIWQKLRMQESVARLFGSLPLPDIYPLKGVHRLRHMDAVSQATISQDAIAYIDVFPEFLPPSQGARGSANARFRDFRDRMLAVDQSAYLESLLVRQDKMSMARSVEARVPFVHWPLAQKLNGIPHDLRVPGKGSTKPLLKAVAERYLPHSVIHRRKVGLRLPYDRWVGENNALGRYIPDLLGSKGRLLGHANPDRFRSLVDRNMAAIKTDQAAPERGAIFHFINLELWLRWVETLTPYPGVQVKPVRL